MLSGVYEERTWSSSKTWLRVSVIWPSYLEGGQWRPLWTLNALFRNSKQGPGNHWVTWKLLSLRRSVTKEWGGQCRGGECTAPIVQLTFGDWLFHENVSSWDFFLRKSEFIGGNYIEMSCFAGQLVKKNRWEIVICSKEADITDNYIFQMPNCDSKLII